MHGTAPGRGAERRCDMSHQTGIQGTSAALTVLLRLRGAHLPLMTAPFSAGRGARGGGRCSRLTARSQRNFLHCQALCWLLEEPLSFRRGMAGGGGCRAERRGEKCRWHRPRAAAAPRAPTRSFTPRQAGFARTAERRGARLRKLFTAETRKWRGGLPPALAQVTSPGAGCPAAAGGAVRREPRLAWGQGGGSPGTSRLFGEAVACPGFGMARTARGLPRVAAGPLAEGALRSRSPGVGSPLKIPSLEATKRKSVREPFPSPPISRPWWM